MTKEEIIERLESIRDDIEVVVDHADELLNTAERRALKGSVFNMPFENVHRMLDTGLIDLFNVGDVIVNQHKKYGPVAWQIIGVNVDKRLDVPHTLTLLMKDVLPGSFVYDTESKQYPYGHAHYPTSTIRRWLNEDFLAGFDLASDVLYMQEVEKVTYTVDDEGGKPETTSDKLFLLSASEVGFSGDYVRNEGPVYPFFDGCPENRCKTEMFNPQSARSWWLRSPSPSNANYARYVGGSGALYSSSACSGSGAAAACIIG